MASMPLDDPWDDPRARDKPRVYRVSFLGGFADGYTTRERRLADPPPRRIWVSPCYWHGQNLYRGMHPVSADFDQIHCMWGPTRGYEPYKLREVQGDGDKSKNWVERGVGGTLAPIAVYEHGDLELDEHPGEKVGVSVDERERELVDA